MRKTATFFALLLTTLSTASVPNLGTKSDIVLSTPDKPTSMLGTWDMVQMLVALVIVFVLLKWALPKIVSRMNKKLVTGNDSTILVEESANFGGGSLQIVTARNRTLLLCVAQNGVTCLADLTEKDKPKEEEAFFELMDEASEMEVEQLKAVVEIKEETPVEQIADNETQVVLERLKRLTG